MNTSRATSGHAKTAVIGSTLSLPALLMIFLIIMVPTVQMLRYSFNHYDPIELMRAGFTLDNYVRFFSDTYYLGVMWTTVKVAALCTCLALLLGFPVAYALAKTQSRHKNLLVMTLIFPMLIGNVVRAAGWMVVLGDAGFVNAELLRAGLIQSPIRLMYTPTAVIVGITSVVLPYMVLTLQSVLEGIDLSIEEAAMNLGANFFQTLRKVILPISVPGIAAGTMLIFILCMNAYSTPVLLGGTGITMMAPAIYDQIAKTSNWPFGGALAVVLMIVTLVLALASNWFIHRRYAKSMTA